MTPHDFAPAPSKFLQLMELRAGAEWAAGLLMMPWLARAPKGDGHGVLVIPGLLAGDGSTKPLRGYLESLGYQAEGWGQGRNYGPRPGTEEGLLAALESMAAKTGGKVSLVGQSLGGVYARLIAAQRPDLTRQVVTLGSPVQGSPKSTNAWRVYEFFSGNQAQEDDKWKSATALPKVPSTSVFSRTDGIVAWATSRVMPSPTEESIEIVGSHLGMALHPAALHALADRLAQPESSWRPFERSGWRDAFYPDPYRD
jgi:pimeloyl-ACP methyl ester carboxylesterase